MQTFQGVSQPVNGVLRRARGDLYAALLRHVHARAPSVQADHRLACRHGFNNHGPATIPQAGEQKRIAGGHLGQQLIPRHRRDEVYFGVELGSINDGPKL